MASKEYYQTKIHTLMIELSLQKLTDHSKQQYEERIQSLKSQLLVANKEAADMAAMAEFWADAYNNLLKFGIKQEFADYNTGFGTGAGRRHK